MGNFMNLHLQSDEIEMMDEIQDGLAYTLGESNVSVTQLMTDGFIAEHTDFLNWNDFLKASGVRSEKDFGKAEFDKFIKRHTDFEEWKEMLVQSANKFVRRREEKELNSVL
jgi:hypothetical protein